LNTSKPSNGLYYGLFTGTVDYLIFAIPAEQFVLNPEYKVTLSGVSKNIGGNNITFSTIQLYSVIFSVTINLLFGITLSLVASLLSIRLGAIDVLAVIYHFRGLTLFRITYNLSTAANQ
jgi:hypothetical protein